MAVYIVSVWRRSEILVENRDFFIPRAFNAPLGVPVGMLPYRLVWKKNYNGVPTRRWKKFEDMFNRLDRIPACERQSDRRTDG